MEISALIEDKSSTLRTKMRLAKAKKRNPKVLKPLGQMTFKQFINDNRVDDSFTGYPTDTFDQANWK